MILIVSTIPFLMSAEYIATINLVSNQDIALI